MVRGSTTFTGGTSGTVEVSDILPTLTAAVNEGFTIGPILFDMATMATGTGTGLSTITMGLMMGPSTLDAADLDPSANPNIGWWYTRKFYLAAGATVVGPLEISGQNFPFRVATARKVPALSSALFLCSLPTFTGFTAVESTYSWIATVILP